MTKSRTITFRCLRVVDLMICSIRLRIYMRHDVFSFITCDDSAESNCTCYMCGIPGKSGGRAPFYGNISLRIVRDLGCFLQFLMLLRTKIVWINIF